MKKSLLAASLVMAALSASAQIPSIQRMGKVVPGKIEKNLTSQIEAKTPAVKRNKVKANAEAASSVAGEYVLNYNNWDGDFTECMMFTVKNETGTITLDYVENKPTFDYNVVLEGFTYSDAVAYGYYNEEDGTISIPPQVICNIMQYGDKKIDYGPVLLTGCTGAAGDGIDEVGYEIVLEQGEGGIMEFSSDLYGWCSMLPEYETGESAWNYGFEPRLLPVNSVMEYASSGSYFNGGQKGWVDGLTTKVNVEDYGVSVIVNNFLGLCPIEIEILEDGSCRTENCQKVIDYELEEPYLCYMLMAGKADGNYLVPDVDAEYIYGNLFERTDGSQFIGLFGIEPDDQGNMKYADDPFPYVRVGSYLDADNAAYTLGWLHGISIDLPTSGSGDDKTTGIVNANESRIQKVKNTKAYNLMGQEVDYRNSKGVIVLNGKKYIAK